MSALPEFDTEAPALPEFDQFTDLSAGQEPIIKSPRMPGDVRSTTAGGPPLSLPEGSAKSVWNELAEEYSNSRVTTPKFTVNKDDNAAIAVGKEAVNIAASIPEFFTSDLGLSSVVTGAAAPVATAGAFTVDMLKSAGEQIASTYKNWDQMTGAQKAAALTDIGGTGLMAALTGKHATTGALNEFVPARKVAKLLNESKFTPEPKPGMALVQPGQPSTAPPMVTADDLTKQPTDITPTPVAPVPEPAPVPQAAPSPLVKVGTGLVDLLGNGVQTDYAREINHQWTPETQALQNEAAAAEVSAKSAPKGQEGEAARKTANQKRKVADSAAASETLNGQQASRLRREKRQWEKDHESEFGTPEYDKNISEFDDLIRRYTETADEEVYHKVKRLKGSQKTTTPSSPEAPRSVETPAAPETPAVAPKLEEAATAPEAASTPKDLALQAQREAGWDTKWPFVPADFGNPTFREAIESDPTISAAEKDQMFSSAEKLLGGKIERTKPAPETAAQKMEGPGSPSRAQGPDSGTGFQDQSGRDIYGIAARVREQRAKAGQVAPVESGEGVSPKESVEWGRELLAIGVDPEAALNAFEKDPTKKIAFDLIAFTRAHGEALAKAAVDIESKFGTDTTAYRTAKKALDDWDARTKKLDTQWHKIGQAMQGHTDIDTGTFTGINRAYREITGEELPARQVKTAKKIAKGVADADGTAKVANEKLNTTIDNLPGTEPPRYSPQIIKIAERIVATLDVRANKSRKALREMASKFNTLPDPTVILHLTNIGAAHIGHWGLDFAKWSDAMIKDVGPKLEEWLKKHDTSLDDLFKLSQKMVDAEGDKHGPTSEPVKEAIKKTKATKSPVSLEDQRKVFGDFQSGQTMTPEQVKTLWQRAKIYIDKSLENTDPKADIGMADVVHKVAVDLGIPARDVLGGLSQNGAVRRVADNVWQKQRQARILKASAKRWIEKNQETWLAKSLPSAARLAFSAKTGLHGTVALGTHAPLVAATHPIIFSENFGKMYKLVGSRDYYEMQKFQLSRRKNYIPAQRGGLVNDMSKMEDFSDPQLRGSFPKMAAWFQQKLGRFAGLQGMGTRGYSVLKILRQDLFDHEWDKLPDSLKFDDQGQLSPQGLKLSQAISDSVNHITGVVKSKVPSAANYALFAPKLMLSRLAVTVVDPARAVNSLIHMGNMSPAEKWFAANQFKQVAKIFAVSQGLLLANQQLNKLFGDDKKLNGVPESLGGAGYNPMASDFMKFRVAGMNVAWASPFLTMTRLPLRLVQIGMGDGGKSKFLIYPDESMYKTIGSYLRTQASPFLQPIASLAMKADYQNRPLPQIPFYGPPPPMPKRLAAEGIEPYTWNEFASDIILPIPFQEGAKEVFHYGMGATPEQQAALRKGVIISIIMSATGGRISEDWNKK